MAQDAEVHLLWLDHRIWQHTERWSSKPCYPTSAISAFVFIMHHDATAAAITVSKYSKASCLRTTRSICAPIVPHKKKQE
eukprot:1158151-Pelagomonas_calceolata.AAC.3